MPDLDVIIQASGDRKMEDRKMRRRWQKNGGRKMRKSEIRNKSEI
jgi:hypothetical protein